MPRQRSTQPTEVELEILNILWDQGAQTVREIHNRLPSHRETAYATTVKMLTVMLDKELVTRDDSVRPQVYKASVTRNRARKGMIEDLVQRAYSGSSTSLIMQLLSTKTPSKEDRDEIRRLLDDMEKE